LAGYSARQQPAGVYTSAINPEQHASRMASAGALESTGVALSPKWPLAVSPTEYRFAGEN
jgi:hypothetical protein